MKLAHLYRSNEVALRDMCMRGRKGTSLSAEKILLGRRGPQWMRPSAAPRQRYFAAAIVRSPSGSGGQRADSLAQEQSIGSEGWGGGRTDASPGRIGGGR